MSNQLNSGEFSCSPCMMQSMVLRDNENRFGRLALLTPVLFFFFLGMAASQETPPPIVPQITLLDGKVLPAANLKVAAGAITADEFPAGTTLDDVRLIQVHASPA